MLQNSFIHPEQLIGSGHNTPLDRYTDRSPMGLGQFNSLVGIVALILPPLCFLYYFIKEIIFRYGIWLSSNISNMTPSGGQEGNDVTKT